ncbi:MAG: extracellular solute-binding protein, partial [Thermoleophilia bacterium]
MTAMGCGSGQAQGTGQQQTLTVSAAISLKDVFTELGRDYQAAHPGVEVKFNFGASGDLEQQIIGGAPVDIFASASSKETDELGQQGRI